jgi:hypothetical protein
VFCVFLFLSAASLFGTIINQVNEIVVDLRTKKKDLDHILETYLSVHPRRVLRRFDARKSAETDLSMGEFLWLHVNIGSHFVFPGRGICRLSANTMFLVRNWERFQFHLECEHQTVSFAIHWIRIDCIERNEST